MAAAEVRAATGAPGRAGVAAGAPAGDAGAACWPGWTLFADPGGCVPVGAAAAAPGTAPGADAGAPGWLGAPAPAASA